MKRNNLINTQSINFYHAYTSVINICLLILVSLIYLTACKKDLKAPVPAPLDAGVLSVSKDTVIIDAGNPGNVATTFKWTAPTNSLVSNSLILSAGNNSDTVTIAQSANNKSFTNSEINTILVNKLKLAINVQAEIKAMLKADVPTNGKTANSNIITLKVTPAPTGPAYSKLWIVGDATPNGWDINNPNQMQVDPTNAFQFKYNEVLNAGEFKIPVTTGNWSADFFMPPTNHPDITSTLVKLIPGGNPDNKWQITTAGAYKILLNISSSPFIKITPFTPYTSLWMVGDATSAGWDIDHPVAMVPTTGNPYEFTYTGNLNVGEFKIPTGTGNWNGDYFMPTTNDETIAGTIAVFTPGGNPDNKWKITTAGNYKVTLNQLYETISIVKM